MKSTVGKWNIGVGLWVMAAFMLYGFYLIYARDFAPGKEVWIANDNISPHFESRLAHVHGNLFAFLNIAFGYLLLRLPVGDVQAKWISGLALTGLLMPIGILDRSLSGLSTLLGSAGRNGHRDCRRLAGAGGNADTDWPRRCACRTFRRRLIVTHV